MPDTATLGSLIVRSGSGRQLGLALTIFAGIGTLLLVLFGLLSRRREDRRYY
jgi:hypothetical protein